MRIVYAVQGFPPEFVAGTELLCEATVSVLRLRGHDCRVLAGSHEVVAEATLATEVQDGVAVTRFQSAISPWWREQQVNQFDPEAEDLIRGYLQTVRPDVVHVHHWLRLTPNLVSLAATLGIPSIVTLHDLWTSCARIHRQHKNGHFCLEPPSPTLCAGCVPRREWQSDEEIIRALANREQQLEQELHLARALLVPSDEHKRILVSLMRLPCSRFQVLPPFSLLSGLQRRSGTRTAATDRRLRLAYWGYLAPHKGVHLILEAVRRLPSPSAVELLLAGLAPDAEYLHQLEELARGLSVTFLGEYRPEQLPAIIDADIAVFPSLSHESHGLVINEAFDLGIPAVVSNRGAPASRVGGAGWVVEAGSAEALAQVIEQVMADPQVLWQKRAAIPSSPFISKEAYAQRLEELYAEAVKQSPHLSVQADRVKVAQLAALRSALASRDQCASHLSEELARLSEELASQRAKLAATTEELGRKDDALARQAEQLAQLEADLQAERSRADSLQGWANHVSGSLGWKILARVYYAREKVIAPPGTWRGRGYDLAKKVFRVWLAGGLAGVFRKARARVDSKGKPDPYSLWIARHSPDARALRRLRAEAEALPWKPEISVVMPVFNPEARWLRKAIESVVSQVYPFWELCICDDGSSNPDVQAVLSGYAQADKRIKVTYSRENEGIASASNRALGIASGEFVTFLDHDDELSPEALYEVAAFINGAPDADVVYTDEDKIAVDGTRYQPFFKPDWCPDMLLSFMYVGHLAVYRRELLERVGAFRSEFEGSQDYDLALRATEHAREIGHIPRVLYHWRSAPGSIAERSKNKAYAYEAGKRALQEALARRGIDGVVEDTFGKRDGLGFYRVRRSHSANPLVSIIIPTRDKIDLLSRCIASIEKLTIYPNYQVVIVDNNSASATSKAYLDQTRHLKLTHGGDFNFSRLMNFAAARVTGDLILFLNNDIEVLTPEWLSAMVEHALRPEVGAVGAKLLYPNNHVQHAGVIVGLCEFAGHAHRHVSGFDHGYWGMADIIRNYSAVTAACMMIRRKTFLDAGGFDEAFQFAYQDVDLCLRLRQKGLLIVYTPYAKLEHYESASRGGKMAFGSNDIALARSRWADFLGRGDPHYNPNLTKLREDFSLPEEGEAGE